MKKIFKINQRLVKVGLFAVALIAVTLLTITQVLADVFINLGSENKVYTNSATTANINLSGVVEENAAFFTKNGDTYSYSTYTELDPGASNLVIHGSWTAYQPKVYYVAFTDYTRDDLEYLDDLSGTDVDSNTVTLDVGLVLHKITVIYDPDEPLFSVSTTPSSGWSKELILTVNAADDHEDIGYASGLHPNAYSFDDDSWTNVNSITVDSNRTVNIKVRDAVGNTKEYNYQITNRIDTQPPSFTVSASPDVTEAGGVWAKSATVTVNATDSQAGMATDAYSFDGGPWTSTDHITVNTQREVSVRVRDALGNISDPNTINITKIDTTAPTAGVTIAPDVIGTDGIWSLSAVITVTGAQDDRDDALADEPYSFDGGATWQSENTFTVTQNGDYTVLVRDAVGNIYDSDKLHVDHIDRTPPVITIDESTISRNWATGTATVEFTVSDNNEVGCNLANITGDVGGTGSVTVTDAGSPNTYIATVTGDPDAFVQNKIKLSAADKLGNSTDVTSTNDILIDNTSPVISIDESTISTDWSASSTSFEFTASDTGSDIDTITGTVLNGHVTITNKTGSTYIATVTANSDSEVEAQVDLIVTDKVNHTATATTKKDVKADAKAPTFSDLTVQKVSGSGNSGVVKDGDLVKVSFGLTDSGSGVNPASVKVTMNGIEKTASIVDSKYTCIFTAGTDFAPKDDSLLYINKINYADAVGNSETTAHNTDTVIKYYSAISKGFSDLKFWSSNADASVAKNGDTVFVSFFTTHPVIVESGTISQSQNGSITWLKQNDTAKKTGSYYFEGSYTVVNDNAFDMQNMKLALTIADAAENSVLTKTQADAANILYYAPMSISGVTISSNNSQDSAQYAKNADTVSVTFATNHDVTVSAASIAGKPVTLAKTDGIGLVKNWTMSYTLANGDLNDLSVVPFTLTISDKAGNTPVSVNNGTAGVLHTLRYYAPITASTSIASNYKYTNYVKNSDTVTVSSRTNHAVTIASSAICGRKANNNGSGSTSLKMFYQIPSGEDSIAEGAVSLNYTIIDAAGNTLTVNRTNDAAGSSVTYDRTNPTVSVDPSSLSFSASTLTYTVTFEDEHLSGQDISVLLNGKEQMTSRDRSSVSGTRYTKTVTLDTDGNYKLEASLFDRAGNASDPDAETSVTVDMTKPQIKAVKLNTSAPKAFKSGFLVSDYFEFVDENIRDIICTVSDSDGTRDWDINEPLTGDGKKTINLVVTDMADNSSTTITYDLYIDGTAPKPVILDTQSQTAVSADQPVTFVSEMELSISLESLNTGDLGTADHFKKIDLFKGGERMVDILNTIKPDGNGVYTYHMSAFGEYTLVLSAADDVGNETGDMEYHFYFNDKSIFQKFYENTPLFVIVVSLLVIGIAALITLRIVKKSRENNAANSI